MSDIPPPTVPPATPPPPGGGSYTPPPPPPPPHTGGAAGGDRTLMVVLAYLWILALIPLLTKKDDPEVQWHAKNGLVFTIAEVILWVALSIIGFAIGNTMGAGCGLTVIQCGLFIAILVVRIMAIVKATSGQRFRLPVISDFADKM